MDNLEFKLTVDMVQPDPENPRIMTDAARQQLSDSITEFGNISEIIWNKKTGQLIAGHQRWTELKAKYPDMHLKVSADNDKWWLLFDREGGVFTGYRIRVVEWDARKQKTANIVANSMLNQGEFDVTKLEGLITKYDLKDFEEKFKLSELTSAIKEFKPRVKEGMPIDPMNEDQGSSLTNHITIECEYEVLHNLLQEIEDLLRNNDKYQGTTKLKYS